MMNISFFCGVYASTVKVAVVETSGLKPADKKRIALQHYLVSSFRLNREKISDMQGYGQEFNRLLKESNFKGHIAVAREIFEEHVALLGFNKPEPIPVHKDPVALTSKASLGSGVIPSSIASPSRVTVASSVNAALFSDPVESKAIADRVLELHNKFHDQDGYPTKAYFDRLLQHLNVRKDTEIEWYVKHSWGSFDR